MLYVLAAVRSRLALDVSAQLLGLIPQIRPAVGLQRRQGALQLLPALHRHTIPLFTLCSYQRKHRNIISQSIKSLFQHMSNKCNHTLKKSKHEITQTRICTHDLQFFNYSNPKVFLFICNYQFLMYNTTTSIFNTLLDPYSALRLHMLLIAVYTFFFTLSSSLTTQSFFCLNLVTICSYQRTFELILFCYDSL